MANAEDWPEDWAADRCRGSIAIADVANTPNVNSETAQQEKRAIYGTEEGLSST